MKSDIIDKVVWEGLREFEKNEEMPGFFLNLLGATLTASRTQMDGLLKAIDDSEAKRVHYYAHTLKSSCASLGALNLAKTLGEIEAAALQKPAVIRQDLIPSVRSVFDQFLQEIQNEYNRLSL
ncbi:Hpt domain-containing protein [Bdellovibrio sp. SKB1291214]|uniref:Hpt domain-containing protein n=1 Tax=Bdellovibrio sp. SKB1291214 TaxID=1732569 RepID=UPI000B51D760|nr:Hpt domain-containing protein [Bdellovibrio sp. SKB1291214]UYL07412.1 Hpt domain-containing protein [Bdellovibrio sp. SKB1291214]